MNNTKNIILWIVIVTIMFFLYAVTDSILEMIVVAIALALALAIPYAILSNIMTSLLGRQWGWGKMSSSSVSRPSSNISFDYKPKEYKTYNWRCKSCGQTYGLHTNDEDHWPPTSGCKHPFYKTHDWRRLE